MSILERIAPEILVITIGYVFNMFCVHVLMDKLYMYIGLVKVLILIVVGNICLAIYFNSIVPIIMLLIVLSTSIIIEV